MSVTQGGPNPWSNWADSPVFSRKRRLDAAEGAGFALQRPNGRRRPPTCSWSEPPRGVVVVELKVAGNDAGDELCSCRSSGEAELVGAVVLEARGQLLRGLRGAVRSVDKVAWPLGGWSYVGDELTRRRVR